MKILILLLSGALSFASAGYASYGYYNQYVPVIGPNGVPIDTPEVQAAKQQHFAAVAAAKAQQSGYPNAASHIYQPDTPEVAAAKQQHYHDYAAAAHRNHAYQPYNHYHNIHYGGGGIGYVPVDTPEVQHAKAQHFAAHAAANQAHYHNGGYEQQYRRRRRRSAYYYPIDTIEVQKAKAEHFAAHAEARARNAAGPYYHYLPQSPFHQQYFAPFPYAVIGPNGQPVETPEVQAAKASHFAAYAKALAGQHYVH